MDKTAFLKEHLKPEKVQSVENLDAAEVGHNLANQQGAAGNLARLARRFLPRPDMVFIRKREQRLVDDFLQRATADGGFALNIGSGNISYGDRCVNLDVFEGEHVDVVSPAAPLPFNDATFDGVMSLAVLEHVPDDRAVLAECQRVLKPGGLCLHAVPFMQGFHAVPDDYRRFTQSGLRELLAADFDIEATGVLLGPASSVAWLLREFFAILTSFGSPLLYNAGMLFWGWIFWPIKFLDLFLASHPFASQIASGVYILACKKDG